MNSKIARRLFAYFGTALILFALAMGSIFVALYRQSAVQLNRDALRQRAEAVASALSGILSGNPSGGTQGGGYGVLLRMLDEVTMADAWVVDRDFNLITAGMRGRQYAYADLPADAEAVVARVLEGEAPFSESFSGLLLTPTLTVGMPIRSGDAVVGALLLHAPASGVDEAVRHGLTVMGVSLSAALMLSILLAALLAVKFTKPLNRMEEIAGQLAGGSYGVKTGVRQGDEIGHLASAIDQLSDRLGEAEAERERLTKLRQDFIANISHELRTPVTALRGSLEALCDRVVEDPVQVEAYHRQMLTETVALQRLVDDLMDLTKLENVDFPMDMQPINLCDAIDDAARAARSVALAKRMEIQTVHRTPIIVIGDYFRLRQMILIVLDNAVKYSPDGASVTMEGTEEWIEIRDNGPGIPAEELPLLFDRFYRASTARDSAGSGLGLAIAKRIAERHGIRIEVTSRVGEGSVFRFVLPKAGRLERIMPL